MLISCYSLTALAQRAEKLMPTGGSILTLTYYGAEKVMPHYNVMGVAKAALEAIAPLSRGRPRAEEHPRQRHLRRPDQDARRIRHRRFPLYPEMERAERAAPPHRDDRGRRAARRCSCSPTFRGGVTGEVVHVDAGYHVVGMKAVDAPDIATVIHKD